MLLDYFPESQASKVLLSDQAPLNSATSPSGPLGLLPVILVQFSPCIGKDSVCLHVTGKTPR